MLTKAEIIDHVASAIDHATTFNDPFTFITIQHIFPENIYEKIICSMPDPKFYRSLPGRNNDYVSPDGVVTRTKMDLFPEFIRHLPSDQRSIWGVIGAALTSPRIQSAFKRKLAEGLQRRFGGKYADIEMYPIPILTRDTAGYRIPPHTDTRWKGITVQIYLPADDGQTEIGTIMNRRNDDGSFSVARKMRFAPNTGYAFAVNDISWHSTDTVGPNITSRDSILLTYFVDSGVRCVVRNRMKRAGNLLRNEFQRVTRRIGSPS